MRWSALPVILAAALASAPPSALAATPLQPQRDDEVIEVLPLITRNRPAVSASAKPGRPDALAAALAARKDIAQARQTGDTRYWGRAQSTLSAWWDRSDAPVDIAVLQATVQQGRHEFAASRQVLAAALARAPGHAQGWLNLAALERLSGSYAQALQACAKVGQALYAQACKLETQSLQGEHQSATQGLQALMKQATDDAQRAWLSSLLAEGYERAGDDALAAKAYQQSLSLEADLYTAIAYSDLLLRIGRAEDALAALSTLPETDAVLLRRAAAWKRLSDERWRTTLATLSERTAELKRRGDDPTLHGRELALTALWLEDNPRVALAAARQNLVLQREPIDWWVALQSAKQSKDDGAVFELQSALRQTGLQDARLTGKP
jgi:tetratricopeptide (TPR) repeat protein